MTDNENIKALEQWIKNYEGTYGNFKTLGNALDLITRQQAENDKLKIELKAMRGAANSLKMHYEKAQSEIDSLKIFRGYAKKRASDYRTMRDKYLNAKSEAAKEFAEKIISEGKALGTYDVRLIFDSLKRNGG